HEAGTVLLLVIFFAAAILISMAAVLPRIVMQGRREKEAELAWRGEQYVRAIRLYYRKYGHFPRSVEDFSKNPGNLHFLRKEYKDPMNTSDGSWRFIYVGPGGQLIGSLTRTMPLGVVPLTAAGGSPFGNNPNAGPGGATGFGQSGTTLGGGAQGGAAQGGSQSAQGQPPAPPSMGDSSAGAGTGGDQSGDPERFPHGQHCVRRATSGRGQQGRPEVHSLLQRLREISRVGIYLGSSGGSGCGRRAGAGSRRGPVAGWDATDRNAAVRNHSDELATE